MQFSLKRYRVQECFCLLDVHFVKPIWNQYQDTVTGLDFFKIRLCYGCGSILNAVVFYRQKLPSGSCCPTGWGSPSARCAQAWLTPCQPSPTGTGPRPGPSSSTSSWRCWSAAMSTQCTEPWECSQVCAAMAALGSSFGFPCASKWKKLEFSSSLPPGLVPVAGCGIRCSAGVVRAGEGGVVLQVRAQQGLWL